MLKSQFRARNPRMCKAFKEPRNRFLVWRAIATTLLDVPTRQATKDGGIDSLESIPGLLKRLQIRALVTAAEFSPPPPPNLLQAWSPQRRLCECISLPAFHRPSINLNTLTLQPVRSRYFSLIDNFNSILFLNIILSCSLCKET